MKRTISVLLAFLLVMSTLIFASCSSGEIGKTPEAENKDGYFSIRKSGSAVDLKKLVNKNENDVNEKTVDERFASSFYSFASEMLKHSYKPGENTLVSPTSALYALAMTANGANADVQSDMLHVIADGLTMDELNAYLYNYSRSLMSGDGYTLSLADSVWFRNDGTLKVNEKFLEKVSSYYDADIFGVPYDETTVKDINDWVSEKTDKMIKKIYDSPDDFSEMALTLINAVAFDAAFENTEYQYKNKKLDFVNSKGEKEKADFFGYNEYLKYIKTDDETGFLKYYAGGKYALAAFLPNDGVSIDDYVLSFDAGKTASIISSGSSERVELSMPEFKYDVSFNMNDMLKTLGMESAFNGGFENMAVSEWGDIYIGRVFQKTHIEMMPTGTKAAAVTVVEMKNECAPVFVEPYKITLDRPFVYLILDTETNLPLFIGAVNTTK